MVAKGRMEAFLMADNVRANQNVIKLVGKIVDSFRHSQVLEKEIRSKTAEIERIQTQLDTKRAEISNSVLSTSLLIINLSQEEQMADVDRLFIEGDDQHERQRQTVADVSRLLRFVYATDPLREQNPDFINEVNMRAADVIID